MHAHNRSALLGALGVLVLAGSAAAQDATSAPPSVPAAAASSRSGLITTSDIKAWNVMRQNAVSNDGRWFAYIVSPSEADATLVYRGTAENAPETRVSLGGEGGGAIAFSGDSRWLGYIVAPPRPPAAGAARAGAARPAARDSAAPTGGAQGGPSGGSAPPATFRFVLLNLATGETKEFERIRRFRFNADDATWIAMSGSATADAPRPPGAPAGAPAAAPAAAPSGGPPAAAPLLLYNLRTGELFNMGVVGDYAFDDSGEWLAYTMQTPDRVGNGLQLRNMRTNVVRSLDSERALYRHLAWVDSSRAISVMRAKFEDGARDTAYSIVAFRRITASGAAQKLVYEASAATGMPDGWKLASERAPRYARDMSTVFIGIREVGSTTRPTGLPQVSAGAPGMGGSINQGPSGATDSIPSLILWHARDPRLQSQQLVQEQAERNVNYLASYRFDTGRFVRLADDDVRAVTVTAGDRYAFAVDSRPYELVANYSGRNYQDVYAVDLNTGARRMLLERRPSGPLSSSPDGRRLLFWGADGHWWTLDLATGDTVNITRNAPVSFVNEESDYNRAYPPANRTFGWSRDGAHVLLYDGWDVWRVPTRPGASAIVNLTGDGRATQTRYTRLYSFPTGRVTAPEPGIDLSKPLFFGTYGEWTKHEGFARVDARRPGAQQIFAEDARFNIIKARDAETYLYTRQTFTEYPDYWVFRPGFRDGYRITDINPQRAQLAWSSGTRLIDYTTTQGQRLQGALYLPANYEPGKQYPLLVTIYEKRSQNKNSFVSPSETRTPDPTLYTNRGYAVLDPDIVYHVNDPGMSAVWAVVPAVEAAIATGIVDPKRVGLWGHSWGGYQTAFLVTQTNIFAAAVAGAPLTDMISMYSSVYWNTGGPNQAIFESSQGRFRGNFLENTEAYIRNSPAYHADKVQTPLIIMHNDKDGAVDFNQGITFFNTLRQLGRQVILLEYVGENHGLSRPANQRDYAQRMAEWFDHYLKGEPAPEWITDGVPRLRMDEHLRQRREAAARAAAPISN